MNQDILRVLHCPSATPGAEASPLTGGQLQSVCDDCASRFGFRPEFITATSATQAQQLIEAHSGYAGLVLLREPNSAVDDATLCSALLATEADKPLVEVHSSHHAGGLLTPLRATGAKLGFVAGLGAAGLKLAIAALRQQLGQDNAAAIELGDVSATSAEAPATLRIINGPNLNLLGSREPEIYGYTTLADIQVQCEQAAQSLGINLDFLQSNHEGQIVGWIQEAIAGCEAIIINAAAYTHTSVAIHDALKSFPGRKIELHLSNPHLREPFRHLSYVSSAVDAVVAGLGAPAYAALIQLLAEP